MLHQMNRPSLQSPLKILCVLVLHLLLTHSCRGQSQLIGSSQPIVATVGGDIILPCKLQPAKDVLALNVEWTRPDLSPRDVHVCRAGQEIITVKHPSYKGRTSVSINRLKQGDISLKLSKVKFSDGGKYTCYIPHFNKESFVELVVVSDVIPSPVISVAGLDRVKGGVVLQCESEGWYPQPEVFWLDSEGNLLSAEPTETVRGLDGLYTVSSRVTVEKRRNNNFTCRVQQNNINQTSETHFIVPGDFFKVLSSSSPVITGLAVSLVVFIVVVTVSFFVWKRRQNKTKRSCRDEGDPEMQPLNGDGKTLKIDKLLQLHEENQSTMRDLQTLKENLETKNKELETIKAARFPFSDEEQQRKEQTEKEKEVETLMKELQTKQEEFETKTKEIKDIKAELQQIGGNQKKETDLQRQTEETNNKELETDQTAPVQSSSSLWERKQADTDRLLQEEKQKREKAEKEVKDLKTHLDSKQKQWEKRQAELLKEKQKREKDEREVKDLKTHLDSKQKQIETLQESEKQLKAQNEELKGKQDELLKEKQDREKAEREVKDLKYQLDSKDKQKPRTSQHNNTNLVSQNSTNAPVSVEVDSHGKYISFTNKSKEDLKLEGWKLRVKLNDEDPIMYTFEKSIILRVEEKVTIWGPGSVHLPPYILVWEDLKRWTKGDKLLVELINCDGEIVKTTEV